MSLAFEQVSFSYNAPARRRRSNEDSTLWAVRDLSFSVAEGEILGIAGRTGGGKSTVLRLASGLERPTLGSVLANGVDPAVRAGAHHHALAGMVFQYPEHQLFAATVLDEVAFGPRNLGASEDEAIARANEAMRRVGLDSSLLDVNPFALSGGQRRRVALASVLSMHPHVLALDEPTAGLDAQGRRSMLALFDALREKDVAILVASHSADELTRVADRILVLDNGAQARLGEPASVFARTDELKALGLNVPKTYLMARQLRKHGFSVPESPASTEELATSIAADLAVASR